MSPPPCEPLCDQAVRVELGISLRVAAKLAGVAKNTLTMYEAAPHVVRPEKRAVCVKLYKLLRHVLEHAPGKVA